MAATSPYSGNDYAAVSNFRPYELPINDIFKSISAQNQFWDAGAARVKGVYDNALGLKLSKEQNQQIRDKYMQDTEKQLTKLSSMDLSDPSVQRQGFALFKPLFKDEGVLYDDLATRHYDKVRNDALMYRSKDNGKEYSDINMQYAMQGYREFLASPDRMAGKAAYENRKEYEPFYDYTEDFSKALKDCTASSVETQSPVYGKDGAITGYMQDSYIKTRTAAQAKGCLEAGLSTKAARQLQIEGSVTYKNNPDVLASDTATYLNSVTANLSEQLQSIQAKKAGLQKNTQGLSATELAAVNQQLDEQAKSVTEELDKTNHSVTKLNAGDYTDMLNNFDNYAGSVYSWKKLYKKALASSFEEQRNLYKADPVQMSAIKFSQDKYLSQLDFSQAVSLEQMKEQHDLEMKSIEMMYGKGGTGAGGADVFRNPLTGQVTINPNLMRETGDLTDKPTPDENAYTKIIDQVSTFGEQDKSNDLRLYNNMIARAERDKPFRESLLKGFNLGTTEDDWKTFKTSSAGNRFTQNSTKQLIPFHETAWFKAYSSQNPNDEDANKWANDHMTINIGINTLNRKIQIAEAEVKKRLGAEYDTPDKIKEKVSTLPSINVGGKTLSATDVYNALHGINSTNISVETKEINSAGDIKTVYIINGKKYGQHYSSPVPDELKKLESQIYTLDNQIPSKIKKTRAAVYNELGFDREAWYFTPNDGKAPLVTTLKAVLPKTPASTNEATQGLATKDADVQIISSDFSGGVKVSIPGVQKNGKGHTEDIMNIIRKAGVGTTAEVIQDGIVVIKGTTHNLVPQAINNPVLQQAAYQLQTVGETAAFQQTQDGAKVANSDIQVPLFVNGTMKTMTIETYKDGSHPEYRVFVEGSVDSRPVVTASNPYDLFEKIAHIPGDLKKPVR